MNANKNAEDKFSLLNYLIIFLISLIPVYYTWGRLAIGGDIMIPFNSGALEKYLYQWLSVQNGQYVSINYLPLYICYKLSKFFNLTIYQISSVLLFALNIIAGLGVYKLIQIFHSKKDIYASIPISFYLLSPALLNAWHYLWIYPFIPWFFYFIFKIIKNREIKISDVILLNVILFISSLDLPNPKYIFHLYLSASIILILSFLLRIISLKFLINNKKQIFVFFLLSSYLYIPLGYFVTQYQAADYGVDLKHGAKISNMLDFGSATIDKMVRLHLDNLALNTKERTEYNSNSFIQILSYTYIFVIFLNFLLNRSKNRRYTYSYELICIVLVLIYLFFASGSNPPFGFIYEFVVTNYSLFAFLRTTAGAVFYLSIFYSMLLFFFIINLKKYQKIVSIVLISIILIISYPLINGIYYKNVNEVNPFTDREAYGFKIPNEYFEIKENIDQQKIDAKVMHSKSNLQYINTQWGFFGPIIYNFMYNCYSIGYDAIYSNIGNHNVGFIFTDNSLLNTKKEFEIKNKTEIFSKGFLNLERVSEEDFLPHFYTPKNIIISSDTFEKLSSIVSRNDYDIRSAIFLKNQNTDQMELSTVRKIPNYINDSPTNDYDIRSAILLKNQNTDQMKLFNSPTIEVKRINPTKYRLRIHDAIDSFPLIFSESFNDNWKLYLVDYEKDTMDMNLIDKYKIFDGNEGFQANKKELRNYIDKGWISSLGDGNKRMIKHNKWENDRATLNYTEPYYIDFISKNLRGTIQNDNLPSGRFYETWFLKSMDNTENHLKVNGYANSWIIDPQRLCTQENMCIKNPDGTYDLEIVVEFWPQRLLYIGWLISSITLFLCLVYLINNKLKNFV